PSSSAPRTKRHSYRLQSAESRFHWPATLTPPSADRYQGHGSKSPFQNPTYRENQIFQPAIALLAQLPLERFAPLTPTILGMAPRLRAGQSPRQPHPLN